MPWRVPQPRRPKLHRVSRFPPNPRQRALVRERGSARVEALAEQLGVTLHTVRRDVKLLADAPAIVEFALLPQLDRLYTDQPPPFPALLAEAGVRLVVADTGGHRP